MSGTQRDVLRLPLEETLTCGADNRSITLPNGWNKYGTSSKPNDVIPFGSCTSSSTSPRGFAAARQLLELLRQTDDREAVAQAHYVSLRRRLRRTLRIADNAEILFTPSGTDVELIATALATEDIQRPIVNIVVGPNEVGSGTPLAAAGCHYDSLVPSGATVEIGDPVNEEFSSRILPELVPLRDEAGAMLETADLDDRVTGLVEAAVARGALPLLHLVAHSKTGMHAPSLACVDRLQRAHEELVVMVDGAQGRFSRKGMSESLACGHLFMLTGSKFFGGPPFSGALVVPERFASDARGRAGFPAGFEHYFSAAAMPIDWFGIRHSLSGAANWGALLRWTAAMTEIEAYYAAPSDARLRVLRFFEKHVPCVFDSSTSARLLTVSPPVLGEQRLLQSKTTVFNFYVARPNGETLDMLALRRLHAQLNSDLSAQGLGSDDVLQRRFHLGQPVKIGSTKAALRLALGGELIVRIAIDERLGATLDDRVLWLGDQISQLQRKIDLILAKEAAAQWVT